MAAANISDADADNSLTKRTNDPVHWTLGSISCLTTAASFLYFKGADQHLKIVLIF